MISDEEEGTSEKREKEIVDKILKKIFEWKIESFAILILESYKSRALFLSQMSMMSVAPFADIIGLPGVEYTEILGKTENIEYIIKKIEEKINKKKLKKPLISKLH